MKEEKKKITKKDLIDGKILEYAVTVFNQERTEEHLFELLQILQASDLWIPCAAVFSDRDRERFDAMMQEAEHDPEKLKGTDFKTLDPTRLIPDILRNGEDYFFPVFSNPQAMGEYGDDFSKVQKSMAEVFSTARNCEKELAGIVLNAFSEPFVLEKDLWDLVEQMGSCIE